MVKNVILIAVDDMIDVVRYRNAFGIEIQTPAIDRLISMGVTFSNAFTPVPLCNPSRAATITGQSPFSTGIHHNQGPQIQDVVPIENTLFGAMDAAGYHLASRGKVLHGSTTDAVWSYLSGVVDDMDETEITDFNGTGNQLPGPYGDSPVPEDEFRDARTAAWAADFLTSYAGDDPFFLSVGISKPHLSWDVPREYYDLYDIDGIVLPEGGSFEDLPAFFQNFLSMARSTQEKVDDAGIWPELVEAYLAALSFADAQIGKILDVIDETGLWDSSTVVLWSDHGYHLGDNDVWKKFTLWEEAASVPFVIADPDVARGSEINAPVSLLDLWPTLAGLTDIAPPQGADGIDLSGLMRGEVEELSREGVVTAAYGSLSIRTETWRYTLYSSGEEELYNVGLDTFLPIGVGVDRPWIATTLRESLRAEAENFGVTLVDSVETGTEADEVFTVIGDATAQGGSGDDIYFASERGIIVEQEGGGHDKVFVGAEGMFRLPDNVEVGEILAGSKGGIVGNDLDNTLDGGNQGNTMRGGQGNDRVHGWNGNDMLEGNKGNDRLFGDQGNDRLFGDRGNDRLFGGFGKDRIIGDDGNDRLFGGEGRDRLRGGTGDDILDSGSGPDKLHGGGGADTFVFHKGDGKDVVLDFKPGVDRIEIDGALLDGSDNVHDILHHRVVTLANALILDFGEDQLTIANVTDVSLLKGGLFIV